MTRTLAALLVLATLAAIGGYVYWTLPQGQTIPGFGGFLFSFASGLALPYLATLALLARGDGRNGLRFALGAALANAVWALPLGAVFVLFAGFALGNRDQLHQIFAVAAGALVQLPLLAVAGIGLWRSRAVAAPAPRAWVVAFALPIAASGASWTYFNWQAKAFQQRSDQAMRNDRAAKETVQLAQACLASFRASGYPAKLDSCPEAAARTGEASGYRFEYLPALAPAGEPIRAFLLCAQPIEFRATGFDTVVVDASGRHGAGVAAAATPDHPPTCASVLAVERAIAWCAYAQAAREPAKGYPARLADMASCVAAGRTRVEIGADRLRSEHGEPYVYLADAPGADGRIARFRVYRFGGPGGAARWIDSDLRESEEKTARAGPVLEGLPDVAAPERLEPGCAQGRAEDCYVAGLEWQRKAHQAGGKDDAPLLEAALKAFGRGCELNEPRACSGYALEIETGVRAERDVVRAAGLYEKACKLGWALGCRGAADMHASGRRARPQSLDPGPLPALPKPDLPRDTARAIALYERACELHDADSCFIAARILAAGEGVESDPGKAFALFARLCDDGSALACARAAGLGAGTEKDYLRRACALGETSACSRAGG